ncbi:MAG TPA: hypothetical protein VK669_02185 [Candidatus Limnocylindrales bacterium]|nr:hypothetical protein [Candidatus Limnocylindrales bacterium]
MRNLTTEKKQRSAHDSDRHREETGGGDFIDVVRRRKGKRKDH